MSGRSLQALLTFLGAVAFVAGASTLLLGADSIQGVERVAPSADSEMRFYAVWYAIAGLVLLRAAPRVESAGRVVRVISAGLFVAGCARGLSWMDVGRPHDVSIVLMIVELTLPLVLIPWASAVEARGREEEG